MKDFVLLGLLASTALCAPTCPLNLTGSIPKPSVAAGYKVGLVTNSLSSPRSIIFDSAGHMLVVQSGVGIQGLKLEDHGGTCVGVASSKNVVTNSGLNHGIALSQDGRTLYASSVEAVYAWTYDASSMSVTSGPRTIVQNMTNDDHNTRTLLLSKKKPGTLLINRGSNSNIDPAATQLSSGHSQVKAFDLTKKGNAPYDFTSDGLLLGWGLRNDVGISEEPTLGGIYTVENSVDQISRYGQDFHEDNPGEELNYLGTLLNNKSPNQGGNFGYPICFSAWAAKEIPGNENGEIKVGMPFALNPDSQYNDTWCQANTVAPRLVFAAHQAPLDIKFTSDGKEAWVTFHGSWDRDIPIGYKVAKIAFENGEPIKPSTSRTPTMTVVRNSNISACPDNCFRPVGLAMGKNGRIFFSSDATGEIYVIQT